MLYLLSILYHAYIIIIDQEVGAQGHGRDVFGGLNNVNFFISVNFAFIKGLLQSDGNSHISPFRIRQYRKIISTVSLSY